MQSHSIRTTVALGEVWTWDDDHNLWINKAKDTWLNPDTGMLIPIEKEVEKETDVGENDIEGVPDTCAESDQEGDSVTDIVHEDLTEEELEESLPVPDKEEPLVIPDKHRLPAPKPEKICEYCGKHYEGHPSSKYCSPECKASKHRK